MVWFSSGRVDHTATPAQLKDTTITNPLNDHSQHSASMHLLHSVGEKGRTRDPPLRCYTCNTKSDGKHATHGAHLQPDCQSREVGSEGRVCVGGIGDSRELTPPYSVARPMKY